MNHYINDELKNKYVLELKVGTTYQNSQKYDIPKVSEGIIEINVELADGVVSGNNSTITTNSFAGNIQTKGLLIYVTTIYSTAIYINGFVYYDQYIDFVSGKEHITYIEKAGETQWLQTKNVQK